MALIWRFRRKQREREARRLRIIWQLRAAMSDPEFSQIDRSYLSDFLLYAEVGRDRMDLPDDYATKAIKHVRESTWR